MRLILTLLPFSWQDNLHSVEQMEYPVCFPPTPGIFEVSVWRRVLLGMRTHVHTRDERAFETAEFG